MKKVILLVVIFVGMMGATFGQTTQTFLVKDKDGVIYTKQITLDQGDSIIGFYDGNTIITKTDQYCVTDMTEKSLTFIQKVSVFTIAFVTIVLIFLLFYVFGGIKVFRRKG